MDGVSPVNAANRLLSGGRGGRRLGPICAVVYFWFWGEKKSMLIKSRGSFRFVDVLHNICLKKSVKGCFEAGNSGDYTCFKGIIGAD